MSRAKVSMLLSTAFLAASSMALNSGTAAITTATGFLHAPVGSDDGDSKMTCGWHQSMYGSLVGPLGKLVP